MRGGGGLPVDPVAHRAQPRRPDLSRGPLAGPAGRGFGRQPARLSHAGLFHRQRLCRDQRRADGALRGTINPNSFDVDLMVFVLTWAIVGGTATFYGPILGCVVLTVLNEIVLREMGFEQMRPLIYGLIMILSILFLPKGLESLVQKIAGKRPGKDTPERSPAQ